MNASEAARMAGYMQPRTMGMRLYRRLREHIDSELLTLRDRLIMNPDEVMQGITEVARDSHSRDRLNALITLAKIHGLLSERVTLNLDPKQLKAELLGALQDLALQYRQPPTPSIVSLPLPGESMEELPPTVPAVPELPS